METVLTSSTKEVIISYDRPTVLVGERINPTGKKQLSEELKEGVLRLVVSMAQEQVKAGAEVLDINVGIPGGDEVTLLPAAVAAVMEAVDVPLCIDTTNPEALGAALKVYKGKALINSVSCEAASLSTVLPIAKQYGAAVIALLQDDDGIPRTVDSRLANTKMFIERAEQMGIPRNDILVDPSAFSLATEPESAKVLLEAIQRIRDEFGLNITLGASNISFGLPDRSFINTAFLTAAIAAGVTCPIVNVNKMSPFVLAMDLVLERDNYAQRYIKAYRERIN